MHLAHWQLEAHNLVHSTNEQFKGQNKHQSMNCQWHVEMAITADQSLSIVYLNTSKIEAQNFWNVMFYIYFLVKKTTVLITSKQW